MYSAVGPSVHHTVSFGVPARVQKYIGLQVLLAQFKFFGMTLFDRLRPYGTPELVLLNLGMGVVCKLCSRACG